jgi:hypothetical protein
VRRAWYTFPILATPPTAMLHVLPRATACSEPAGEWHCQLSQSQPE